MHRPETKFLRLVKEVHQDLMLRIKSYAMVNVRYSSALQRTQTAFSLINENLKHADGETREALQQEFAAECRKFEQLKPYEQILVRDSEEIVQSVIAFNNLIMTCGKGFEQFFIKFDEQMANMFNHELERLQYELAHPRSKKKWQLRINFKY